MRSILVALASVLALSGPAVAQSNPRRVVSVRPAYRVTYDDGTEAVIDADPAPLTRGDLPEMVRIILDGLKANPAPKPDPPPETKPNPPPVPDPKPEPPPDPKPDPKPDLPPVEPDDGPKTWTRRVRAFAKGSLSQSPDDGNSWEVRVRWPDGSARHAIVTESPRRPLPANAKVAGADVRLTIGGVVYTATMAPSDAPPKVSESRSVMAPADPEGKPHPSIRVVFDRRAYPDGAAMIRATVENCLDVPGATVARYDVSITIDGAEVFAQKSIRHDYLARWTRQFPAGGLVETTLCDPAELVAAGFVPAYLPVAGSKPNPSPTGTPFAILGPGLLKPQMSEVGGRPEIAPYPDWTGRYLAKPTDANRALVLAQGDLAGSWPIHIRESDGSPVTIDRRPQFWLDQRGKGNEYPADQRPKGDLATPTALAPDTAHVPSLAYVPYLLTGDRYYADEAADWANHALLATWPAIRGGVKELGQPAGPEAGILTGGRLASGNQVRGAAWGLRNLADAATALPDDDPRKPYLAAKATHNLAWLDRYAEAFPSPIGHLFEGSFPNQANGWPVTSVWQSNYLAWAADHCRVLGLAGGAKFVERQARFQYGFFTRGPYYRAYCSPSYPSVGRSDNPAVGEFDKAAKVYRYRDFDTFLAQNFGSPDGTWHPPAPPIAGGYGVDARLMILVARRLGWEGADDALSWLEGRMGTDLATRPGWAIAPE